MIDSEICMLRYKNHVHDDTDLTGFDFRNKSLTISF